jgi:uncharacterized protein
VAPRRTRHRLLLLLLGVLPLIAACSASSRPTSTAPSPSPRATATAAATPTPKPTPAPPPYAIAALRARPHASGSITIGAVTLRTAAYTKYAVTWPSGGETMTGVLDIPSGRGPFPVVVVNHGYVPVTTYYAGQDSSKYADPLAAAGFLTLSPNYPGYSGSGPAATGVPSIVASAISDMDLVSALPSLPQADTARVAVAGHSNGGGVSEILMAADPRIRAAVLYAPVSSDMADNARKWWIHEPPDRTGGLPGPDADPTPYALMSPRSWFAATTPPALVMQGTADEDIPAAWTDATVRALQGAGATVRFVSFPRAMHNFRGDDLVRANGLAVDWLRQHLR